MYYHTVDLLLLCQLNPWLCLFCILFLYCCSISSRRVRCNILMTFITGEKVRHQPQERCRPSKRCRPVAGAIRFYADRYVSMHRCELVNNYARINYNDDLSPGTSLLPSQHCYYTTSIIARVNHSRRLPYFAVLFPYNT